MTHLRPSSGPCAQFLKPVKSGRFYAAALEAGRAESSRGAGCQRAVGGHRTSNKPPFIFAGRCGPKRRGHEIATALAIRMPDARSHSRQEENMNSVVMALGVALLPSNVV